MKKQKTGLKKIATNKKARHRYQIQRSFEAGIVLVGTEVKSLRDGHASISESYALITNGEVWLLNSHIPEYAHASWGGHTPLRKRKLLLHKQEIRKLTKELAAKGTTLIPLEIYFNEKGFVKVKLGLAQGKKEHDKRESIKEREADRELKNGS